MQYYFAIFYPAAEGGYIVQFPDIPEAFTSGDDLFESMRLGADALAIAVEEYAKARKEIPAPSGIENVRRVAYTGMNEPGIDTSREPLFQLFAAPEVDMTPVRINVSFPKSTLTTIDQKAQHLGMTRSGFLATAAQAYN